MGSGEMSRAGFYLGVELQRSRPDIAAKIIKGFEDSCSSDEWLEIVRQTDEHLQGLIEKVEAKK